MNIKITPLILFLLLLLVLVVSVLFSKYFLEKEGFISFANNKVPLEPVFIPPYSDSTTSVVKLYDNVFFDMRNANLIEVNGNAIVSSQEVGNVVGNVIGNTAPNSWAMMSKIYVLKREEPVLPSEYRVMFNEMQEPVAVETPESKISTTSSLYTKKMYSTVTDTTDKYQIAYISWGTRTYIHVIRLGSTPKHVASFLMGQNALGFMKMYPESTISVGAYVDDSDSNNGKFTTVPIYDASGNIYQVSKSVLYDQRNGNLVIFNKAANSVKVYGRNGGETTAYKTAIPTTVPVATFEPWLVNDVDNNMVVYMPHDKSTLVMILQMDPTNSSKFLLGKVARFNNQGQLEESSPESPTPTPMPSQTPPVDNGPLSDYYRWLAYWNTTMLYEDKSDDNYIRKTQIVPPVCPSCPSCPSCAANCGKGVCANCGGNGGSGTLVKDGTSIVKNANANGNILSKTVESTGDVAEAAITTAGDVLKTTGTTAGDVLKSTGGEVSSLVRSVGSGTKDILQSTASGTKDILQSTASGTKDILQSTASGTADLLKSAGSGAVGLLKSAGSGAVGLLKNPDGSHANPRYQQQPLYAQGSVRRTGETQRVAPAAMYRGQALGPSDYYTQYGALQPKGDEFIPITADFSAFRK